MGNDVDKNILIQNLVRDYAEKIYYFCVKKTGNNDSAEDLTSDILLNIIAALKKGTVPEYFSACVWRIARNRFSVWVKKTRRQTASEAAVDIGDIEIEDNTADPKDAVIYQEQLQQLRRELSFISSDYRNIVVAYYFQGIKISDIARSLNLPEGTVMSKL